MARKKTISTLQVLMNNQLVGYLEKSTTGAISFLYANSWLSHQKSRPLSLSLPLRDKIYKGDMVQYFFDNLLPDNEQIRQRIHQRLATDSLQSFDLLEKIGIDCIGALQIVAESAELPLPNINISRVTTQQIAKILRNYESLPLGMSNDNDFRISLAGAQEKTAFLEKNGKWYLPKGTTPTTHIFKLPIGSIPYWNIDLSDSVENEWLCHIILKEYGLSVAPMTIGQFEDVKVLIVKRFDRRWMDNDTWVARLPQEDMCQALGFPSGKKYQRDGGPGIKAIMNLLLGSESQEDRTVMMKTQVLFWLLAAVDGHAKNFSIFLNPMGRYRLTPLYDVLSAHPLITPKPYQSASGKILKKRAIQPNKIKMAMSLLGSNNHYKWNDMLYRHFLSTAKNCHFSEKVVTSLVDNIIQETPRVIASASSHLPDNFPHFIADSILNGLQATCNRLKRTVV